jgi:hypothetical protein
MISPVHAWSWIKESQQLDDSSSNFKRTLRFEAEANGRAVAVAVAVALLQSKLLQHAEKATKRKSMRLKAISKVVWRLIMAGCLYRDSIQYVGIDLNVTIFTHWRPKGWENVEAELMKKKKPIVRQGNHPSSCKFITTKSNYCRTRPSLKTSITFVSKTEKVVRQTNQSCPW